MINFGYCFTSEDNIQNLTGSFPGDPLRSLHSVTELIRHLSSRWEDWMCLRKEEIKSPAEQLLLSQGRYSSRTKKELPLYLFLLLCCVSLPICINGKICSFVFQWRRRRNSRHSVCESPQLHHVFPISTLFWSLWNSAETELSKWPNYDWAGLGNCASGNDMVLKEKEQ